MEPFLGQIQPYGFNFPPRGWALCQGQLLPINQYQALFSLLGTMYGGDGRTSFGLPDLRGRSMVGFGQGAGLTNISQGSRGGRETVTLTTANLPSHNHNMRLGGGLGNSGSASNNYPASNAGADTIYTATAPNSAAMNAQTVSNTGGGLNFTARSPYLGINVSIALQGLFPSRN